LTRFSLGLNLSQVRSRRRLLGERESRLRKRAAGCGLLLAALVAAGSAEARPDVVDVTLQTGSIAFASDAGGDFNLYLAPAKGGQPRPLAPDPAQDSGPAWSPDGQRLAFASTRAGTWDIFVLDLREDIVTQLTRGPRSEFDPAWSGDGKFIAYEGNASGNWDVFVVNASGTSTPTKVSKYAGDDFDPAWVGRRSELVWESSRHGGFDLYWSPLGGVPRPLLTTSDPEFHPAVSPDGTRIAFERRDPKGNYDVYVAPIAKGRLTGPETRLTRNSTEEAEPAWSPTGTHLALVVASAAGYFVRTIDSKAGRTTSTVTTSTDGDDFAPAWRAADAPAVRRPLARTTALVGCTKVGTMAGETLFGDGFANVICAKEGDDTLWARGGADQLFGDPGADAMFGEAGADWIYGGLNYGGLGKDRERGGDGDDRLYGRGDGSKDCVWGDAGSNDWARLDIGLDNVNPPPAPWAAPPPWSDTVCGSSATIEAFD